MTQIFQKNGLEKEDKYRIVTLLDSFRRFIASFGKKANFGAVKICLIIFFRLLRAEKAKSLRRRENAERKEGVS